jgi:hypothetical protein
MSKLHGGNPSVPARDASASAARASPCRVAALREASTRDSSTTPPLQSGPATLVLPPQTRHLPPDSPSAASPHPGHQETTPTPSSEASAAEAPGTTLTKTLT